MEPWRRHGSSTTTCDRSGCGGPDTPGVTLLQCGKAVGISAASRIIKFSTQISFLIIVERLYRSTTVTCDHRRWTRIYKNMLCCTTGNIIAVAIVSSLKIHCCKVTQLKFSLRFTPNEICWKQVLLISTYINKLQQSWTAAGLLVQIMCNRHRGRGFQSVLPEDCTFFQIQVCSHSSRLLNRLRLPLQPPYTNSRHAPVTVS